jgi:hypothetical protein
VNVVRFNDPFIEALTAHRTLDADRPAIAKDCITAPLFEFSLPKEMAIELGESSMREWVGEDESAPPKVVAQPWPFPLLRASLSIKDASVPVTRNPVWCNEFTAMRGIHLMASQHDGRSIFLFRPLDDPHRENLMFLCHLDMDGSLSFDGIYNRKRGWLTPAQWSIIVRGDDFAVTREQVKAMTGRVIATVLIMFTVFLTSAMSPQTHVVAVKPNQPQRSVQWLQARTHYTLITHGHPANRPTVKHGERVQSDDEGEIKRMAHNRRAHYRTLRHERYRFARGQRIFVRATWVGPKEWQDSGGKQIYRILEPVTPEANPLDSETVAFPATSMDY